MHIYFFTSTRKSDKLSVLTIATSSLKRAIAMAQLHFLNVGYKGKPKLAI